MGLRSLFLLLCCAVVAAGISAQDGVIKSPDRFLPHVPGTRFTPHHLIVDYFKYADESSPKVKLVQYGTTYEQRPLIAAFVSTEENLNKLEAIRLNHLRNAGLEAGNGVQENIVIVWLSYSVHGNEPAGAESSMAVLYDLVQGNPQAASWLRNTIVIMDPVLNPDGFDRYVQWSNGVSMKIADPSPVVREHQEPWPGGRFNHFYFDLNRDWAWQTQQESRDRLAFFQSWMPHLHADVHEMSSESPYYFAPAAQPYHPNVTEWQKEFQQLAGKNHAGYFDREGWRYFTRERFDLFYPSYGDTYPTFSGAIGMTYEQGGGSFANRALVLDHGDTLTLADRIAHHRMASISTVEVAARHSGELIREYAAYFEAGSRNADGAFKTYVISKTNHPGRLEDFLTILDLNHTRYGYLTTAFRNLDGFNYTSGTEGKFDATPGDIVIPANQPKAVLTHILMEPEGHLTDSITYDITAWSLPMAYGLKANSTTEKLQWDTLIPKAEGNQSLIDRPYAYALEWGSVSAAAALTAMLKKGMVARYAVFPFEVDDIQFPSGTVLFMRGDHRRQIGFDDIVTQVASSLGITLKRIRSGLVDHGKDFGSDDYRIITRPQVLTLAGPEVRSSNLGEIWHFFEEQLQYPLHIINADQLAQVSLEKYTTLILPEGYYSVTGKTKERLQEWVQGGGKIIAIGNAVQKLAAVPGVSIGVRHEATMDSIGLEELVHQPMLYHSIERSSMSDNIPGAIFQSTLDIGNPLCFGLGEHYWTLRTGTLQYNWLPGQGNAIFLDDSPHYFGFAGYKALAATRKTLVAGQDSIGNGSIIYLPDNPLFRSFWYAGKVLFANALFF